LHTRGASLQQTCTKLAPVDPFLMKKSPKITKKTPNNEHLMKTDIVMIFS
jgi:hypothetical protein